MNLKRKLLRAGAVLAVAFAAGHLVQTMKQGAPGAMINAATSGKYKHPDRPASEQQLVPTSASLTTGFGPTGDQVEITGVSELAASTTVPAQAGCSARIALTVEPDAMINALVTAPCSRGERVVLRHAGMRFAARTSADGVLRVRLPALEAEAMVSVFFADSEVVIGSVYVPDMASVQRFGLQWTTSDVFDLRIAENDKIFVGGRAGRDSGRDPAGGKAGGNRIIVLGDRAVDLPMFAEVYTYPADPATAVDVVVEVAITPETCGRALQTDAIHANAGMVTIEPQEVSVPDCGTAGDILVLRDLAPTVQIAIAD